jgi:hypothetical protein
MKENFCITYKFGNLDQKIDFDNEEQFNEFLNSEKLKLLSKPSVSNVVFHMGSNTFSLKELIGEY